MPGPLSTWRWYMEWVGIAGSILLAACGIPELVRTVRRGRCGIGVGMLAMWGLGELLVLTYVICTSMDIILIANYGANLAIILAMARYIWR